MSALSRTNETRGRINILKEELEKEEIYFKWLLESKMIDTDALYSGLMQDLEIEVKTVKERNNMCGFTQGDTEPYFMIKTAFVNNENYYFDYDQKRIIEEYCKMKYKTSKVRYAT